MRQFYHVEGMPAELDSDTAYMTRIIGARFVTCLDGEVDLVVHLQFMGVKTEECAFTVRKQDNYTARRT